MNANEMYRMTGYSNIITQNFVIHALVRTQPYIYSTNLKLEERIDISKKNTKDCKNVKTNKCGYLI